MNRISATKIGLLLLILIVSVTSMAYADGGNFRIRIQNDAGDTVIISADPTTLGTVWTDASNSAGVSVLSISNNVILFQGNIGNDYTDLSFAYTQTDTGMGLLSLSASVGSNSNSSGYLQIAVEDSGYAQPPAGTANFHGILSGAASDLTGLATPTLYQGASSITVQSWINLANQNFDSTSSFGSDGRSSTPPTPVLQVPVGSLGAFAGGDAGSTFSASSAVPCPTLDPSQTPLNPGSTCLQGQSSGGTVMLGSNGYSMFSLVTVNFDSAGQAGFTLNAETLGGADGPPLTGTSNVPEPTSLLLIGSGLVGVGLARRKHGQTA